MTLFSCGGVWQRVCSNMSRRFSCYLALLAFLPNLPGLCSGCQLTEYPWRFNSKAGCCPKCPPGQFLKNRCKRFGDPADCERCQTGHFTDTWNIHFGCAPCTGCSKEHGFQIEHKCSSTANTKCTCRPGYSSDGNGKCFKICDKGEQLKSDDIYTCEPCPEGSYSDEKGTKSCKPWTRCNVILQHGSATKDSVCGSFESNPTTTSKERLSTPETTVSTTLLKMTTVVSTTADDSVTMPVKANLFFIFVIMVAVLLVGLVLVRYMPCREQNQGFHCCFGPRIYTKSPVPVQEEFNDFTSVQVKN
ncbi:tumor necrosis factor receptor superfamily member 5-like [Hemitrygon akajei]|uniref:tumor necrosis factor receptor superfamily member 5-like n=1 Tax=Hemitrygon akajei TaxID=2704970 RepID=UPI003BFA06DF